MITFFVDYLLDFFNFINFTTTKEELSVRAKTEGAIYEKGTEMTDGVMEMLKNN